MHMAEVSVGSGDRCPRPSAEGLTALGLGAWQQWQCWELPVEEKGVAGLGTGQRPGLG